MIYRPKRALLLFLACLGLVWGLPALAQTGEVADLIATLESNAEPFAKDVACRRLAVIGTADAVPALAALLADEALTTSARTALQSIGGPEAMARLRLALDGLSGPARVGVIETLGVLGDSEAVPSLASVLGSGDTAAACAAAYALGRIDSPSSQQSLRKTGLSHPDASVRSAAGLGCVARAEALGRLGESRAAVDLLHAVRSADVASAVLATATRQLVAIRGNAAAEIVRQLLQAGDPELSGAGLQCLRDVPGRRITLVACEVLSGAPTAQAATLVEALGLRGDATALPTVVRLALEAETPVRVPAVRAIAQLGGASEVSPLLAAALAEDEAVATAALNALAALQGEDVDDTLAEQLGIADERLRAVAIGAAGMRGMGGSVLAFVEAAGAGGIVGEAAIRALGQTCGPDELATLTDLLVRLNGTAQLGLAEAALSDTASRIEDKSIVAAALVAPLGDAPADSKCALLRLLRTAPESQALGALRTALEDGTAAVRDTAYSVLGDWPTPEAAPDLLGLAKAGGERRDLGLRGYIRLIGSPGLAPAEKMAMCDEAAALVAGDGEKDQLLGALATVPTIEALRMVMGHLDNPALKERACWAAVTVAEPLEQSHSAEVADSLTRVLDVMANPNMERRVRSSRDRAAEAASR